MGLLIFLAVAFIVFFGLIAGILLSMISPEELKPGRKYVALLRDTIILSIFFVIIKGLFGFFIALPSLFIALLPIAVFRDRPNYQRFTFILLAGALVLAQKNAFSPVALLIFAYAALLSIIDCERYVKNDALSRKFLVLSQEAVRKYYFFLVVVFVLSPLFSI